MIVIKNNKKDRNYLNQVSKKVQGCVFADNCELFNFYVIEGEKMSGYDEMMDIIEYNANTSVISIMSAVEYLNDNHDL